MFILSGVHLVLGFVFQTLMLLFVVVGLMFFLAALALAYSSSMAADARARVARSP